MQAKPTDDEVVTATVQLYANSSEAHYASPRACEHAERAFMLLKQVQAALSDAAHTLARDAFARGLVTPTIHGVTDELLKAIDGLNAPAMHIINSGMALMPPTAGGPEETAKMFASLDIDRH